MSFIYDTIRIENRLDPIIGGKIITTNKGDLIIDNGITTTNLAIGTDNQILKANSLTDEGMEWINITTNLITDFDSEVNNNSDVSSNTSHRNNTSNPHSVTKTQIGLSNVVNTKVNLIATLNPNNTNDSSENYSIGSRWINTSTDLCV
jgi:hypothetical protein